MDRAARRPLKLFALVSGLALALTIGAASAEPSAEAPSITRGRDLVRTNCGGCHATAARDTSRNPRSPALRTLHRRYPIEDLAESMSEGLLNGHTGMPAFNFTDAQAADVMAYLTQLQRSDRPARRRR